MMESLVKAIKAVVDKDKHGSFMDQSIGSTLIEEKNHDKKEGEKERLDIEGKEFAKEEKMVRDPIAIDDESEQSQAFSFNADDALHAPLSEDDKMHGKDGFLIENDFMSEAFAESKPEDEFSCGSLSDDSTEAKDAIALRQKIAKLERQNQANIQRLHELECADEKKSIKLRDNEKLMMKHEQENEELKKELVMKKKFVFRMRQIDHLGFVV